MYLTKSRFTLGFTCPRKLFYEANRDQYVDQNRNSGLLQGLAEGGHQIGALAQSLFRQADGDRAREIDTHDQEAQIAQTAQTGEAICADAVTLFEPTIRHDGLNPLTVENDRPGYKGRDREKPLPGLRTGYARHGDDFRGMASGRLIWAYGCIFMLRILETYQSTFSMYDPARLMGQLIDLIHKGSEIASIRSVGSGATLFVAVLRYVAGKSYWECPMPDRIEWSESLRNQTYEVLESHGLDMPPTPSEHVAFKNADGGKGRMALTDLLSGCFTIEHRDTGLQASFPTASDVLDAGWVLD